MSKGFIIGIDPGASGAMVVFDERDRIQVFPWTDKADFCEELANIVHACEADGIPAYAAVEQVGGFIKGNPSTGSSMFNFGNNAGFIEGVLMAYGIPMEFVRPQRWQKEMHCNSAEKGAAHKRELKEQAQRLFPKVKVTLKNADALLIAEWLRRKKREHL
jgi:Holliday junction resolvasome RuvABC endonuclease subunit